MQADLESIRSNLLQRHGAYVNLTGDERLLQAAQPLVNDFLQALPAQAGQDADWSSSLPRINEAITVPTQVCLSWCSVLPCFHSCKRCGVAQPSTPLAPLACLTLGLSYALWRPEAPTLPVFVMLQHILLYGDRPQM